MVLIFAKKKSYTAGKFMEKLKNASSEERKEFGMKSTKNVESRPNKVAEKSILPIVAVLIF